MSAGYGAIRAVRDVSIEVGAGQLVCLLGANGAGKSTCLRSIVGLHRPIVGSVKLDGEEISTRPAHRVIRSGLAFVPEGRMVVAPLTVEENLGLSRFAGRGVERDLLDRVFGLFPRLKERSKQVAGLLSGGEQQMLAIGRAMMTDPKILLMDEPSMGLAPAVVDLVFAGIAELHKQGQSILLVEQNVEIALEVSEYAYLIKRGEIVASGPAAEMRHGDGVREAYLA
jgi:branched-chain amino acid transport system ATP-binding protein